MFGCSKRSTRCEKEDRAAAWYPGAERIDTTHVRYVAKDVMELMIAKMFMTEI